MDKLFFGTLLPFFFCLCVGCAVSAGGDDARFDDGYEEEVGEARGALDTNNSMSPNSLAPTSLSPDSLSPGSLSLSALSPGSLSAHDLTVIEADTADGAAARQLIKYAVGCALDLTQSFAFSWTDATGTTHDEVYPGSLGIAPGWAASPLDDELLQRLVSGCLAARVNYYGVRVLLSMRSLHAPLTANSAEQADFPHLEGAFWGNLFSATPYLNACYDAADVQNSRDAMRDCAVGHLTDGQILPCGMIALEGPCSLWCTGVDVAGQYYPSCVDRPEVPGSPSTDAIVTTALP